MEKKLYRSRTDTVLAGVCSGLGKYMGLEPNVVRLIAVVLFFCGSLGFWVYIVLAILIPKEPQAGFMENSGLYGNGGGANNGGYPNDVNRGMNGYPNGNYGAPYQGMNGYDPNAMNAGYPNNGMNAGYPNQGMYGGYPNAGMNAGYPNAGYPNNGMNPGYPMYPDYTNGNPNAFNGGMPNAGYQPYPMAPGYPIPPSPVNAAVAEPAADVAPAAGEAQDIDLTPEKREIPKPTEYYLDGTDGDSGSI